MSRVPRAVADPKKLLSFLNFPEDLVEHPKVTYRLGRGREDYKTFIVDGPHDDPNWAKRVMGVKRRTHLVNTTIHMAFAHPRVSTAERKEKMKEMEAAILNAFQAQPMEEDEEVKIVGVKSPPPGKKRSMSPKKSLFNEGDSDAMNSSFSSDIGSPPTKSAKPYQTPGKEGEEGESSQSMEEDLPSDDAAAAATTEE